MSLSLSLLVSRVLFKHVKFGEFWLSSLFQIESSSVQGLDCGTVRVSPN